MNRKRSLSVVTAAVCISLASSHVAIGQSCPGGNCPPSFRPSSVPLRNLSPSSNFSRPGVSPGGVNGQHNKADECPPGTERPPRNCDDVRRMAYQLAAKKGYQMSGNVPFVMTRPYRLHFNDCSTANAHVACMFNDPCTAPHGELLGLRSRAAFHATTLWRGADGTQFECDFTTGSSGIFIANRHDTRVGPAFPDRGESIDPAYDCEKNGATSSALNPGMFGGGEGGPLQNMAILGALMSLLGGQNGENGQQDSPVPNTSNPSIAPPSNQSKEPLPAEEPTPTPIPIPSAVSGGGKTPGVDSGIVSNTNDMDFGDSVSPDNSKDSDPLDEEEEVSDDSTLEETAKDSRPLAVWEQRQESMFKQEWK